VAFAIFIFLRTSACAVPLAPGYRIIKESLFEVHFVPGQTPELQISARYTLQNSGNSDLAFLDVNFPDETVFGRKSARVQLDGRDITLASIPAEYQQDEPDAVRIPFDPPWTRNQTHELSIEYALSSPEDSGARIALDENSFHLGVRGWSPRLLPPKRFLAPSPVRPEVMNYTIRVPANFLVLARGARKGEKKEGDEIEYRFELRKADLAPFIIAGRYVASPADNHSHSAVFWTIQPLNENAAPAAAKITAAWSTLETAFGPLDKSLSPPHIVESPKLRTSFAGESGPEAAPFPGGAMVNPAALALGTGNDEFLEIVDHALAHNWFGDEMYVAPEAALGMGEGLPEFATIVIDEASGGAAARRKRVVEYLRRYDDALTRGTETPLSATLMTSPAAQRRIALAKAPLFFVALEDICGEAQTRQGLAHLVSASRGEEAGYAALRSALEQSTNRNLANPFRAWLNEKGIPESFRSRYQGTAAGDVAQN
jgi:Peptidase family M1 domain